MRRMALWILVAVFFAMLMAGYGCSDSGGGGNPDADAGIDAAWSFYAQYAATAVYLVDR